MGVLAIKLFVDDLTLAACGLPQHVVSVMVAAVDFVIEQFEVVLCMEVSAKKSKVLAGRPAIALAIATRVQSRKLGPSLRARLLGTDTTGGRRRGTQVAQERLRAFTYVHDLTAIQNCGRTGSAHHLLGIDPKLAQLVKARYRGRKGSK